MPKETCLAEETSNSERVVLVVIQLHFVEDISQLVENSIKYETFKIL